MTRPQAAWLGWAPSIGFALCILALARTDTALELLQISGPDPRRAWALTFQSLAWLSGAALFNQFTRRVVWDGVVARALGRPVPGVLKEIVAAVVYLVVVTCIVGFVFERSITGFLAALGAGGVVIGFGLRDLFADVFTGLAINMDRTFAIGDWVQLNEGAAGPTVARIREIGWRSTLLTTEEETTVVLPNGLLGEERVVHTSQPVEPTRYEISVTVEFAVSPERVRRVLLGAAKALQEEPGFVTDREPAVLIEEASSLGVEYLVRYWILPWHPVSPTTARDLVLSKALHHLHVAGISLAYLKSDIYHAPLPNRQVEGHTREDELKLLSNIRLFSPLQTEELERIAGALRRRRVAPGEVLVRAGEEGDSLFIVIEGLLEVLVERDGRLTRVGVIEPGACFGEMSMLTGENRSATVRSVTDSVVYEIGREPVQESMNQRPELAGKLSRILAERQLLTRQALERDASPPHDEAFDSFARQLLDRMREFLGAGMRP